MPSDIPYTALQTSAYHHQQQSTPQESSRYRDRSVDPFAADDQIGLHPMVRPRVIADGERSGERFRLDAAAGESASRSAAGRPASSRRGDVGAGRYRGEFGRFGAVGGGAAQAGQNEADYSFSVGFERGGVSRGQQQARWGDDQNQMPNQARTADRQWSLGYAFTADRDRAAAGDALRRYQLENTPGGSPVVRYLQRDGKAAYLNLASLDSQQLQRCADELATTGAVLLPAHHSRETGYWNPSVTTGTEGRTTIRLTIPDRVTAWKLSAGGITTDALAGAGAATLVAKKRLFGELKLPHAFVDGDQAELVATVHNGLVESGTIDVTLTTTIGHWKYKEAKTIEVTEKGLAELTFRVQIDRQAGEADRTQADSSAALGSSAEPANVQALFELTVAAGETRDCLQRSVPIRPYGMPVFRSKGGTASSDTSLWIALPEAMPVDRPLMQITIGPNIQRSLLDIVLAPAPWCQVESGRLTTSADGTSSDLMAALALADLSAGPSSRPDRMRRRWTPEYAHAWEASFRRSATTGPGGGARARTRRRTVMSRPGMSGRSSWRGRPDTR